MANNQIQIYADMVNLQAASEAFLGKISSINAIDKVLKEGNKNNSLEPDAIAASFVTGNPNGGPRYKLIAHQDLSLNATTIGELGTAAVANKSGFSASVFLDTVTNQYTLSVRSTEFANSIKDTGDLNADLGDIPKYGWAFGQIESLESFWASLKNGSAANGVNAVTIPNSADLSAFLNAMLKPPRIPEPVRSRGWGIVSHGTRPEGRSPMLHGADGGCSDAASSGCWWQ